MGGPPADDEVRFVRECTKEAAVEQEWLGQVQHIGLQLIDLGLREKLVMVALVIPIIWIGVYPNPLLRRIEPSVIELIRLVEARGGVRAAPEVLEPPAESGEPE